MEWHDIFPANMHVKLHHLCKKWCSVSPSGNTVRQHQCGKQTREGWSNCARYSAKHLRNSASFTAKLQV